MNIFSTFLFLFLAKVTTPTAPLDSTTAPKVEKEFSINNGSYFSILEVNCSAEYPIQWNFHKHPRWIMPGLEWNVSYYRVADAVFEDDSTPQLFLSILLLTNINKGEVLYLGPNCGSVANPSLTTPLTHLLNLTSTEKELEEVENGCGLDLWFQPSSHLFLCQSSNTSEPKLSFDYCANPTHCGLSSSSHNLGRENCTGDSVERPLKCNGKDCTSLNVGAEFPIPKIISCSTHNSSIRHMGYFHSLKLNNGFPTDSYVNWEEADPTQLLSIQVSKVKVMANESIYVECDASYFYFSGGMHISLKHVSDPQFTPLYLHSLPPPFAISTLKETLEYYTHNHTTHMPLKRTLLGEDLLLPSGDYKLTCYAPVWNSTHWISKSLLITVANTSTPLFVGGNGTSSMKFGAHMNLTCLAKGIPPPKLSWLYRKDWVQGLEVSGESNALSWTVLTLPEQQEGIEEEFKCHAKNLAGFNEKLFIITKNDESMMMSTRMAAVVVLLGFVGNVIVFFFCWKKLFGDDDDVEEQREFAVTKFLRQMWGGAKVPWCRFRGNNSPPNNECTHPKCRKRTQTV